MKLNQRVEIIVGVLEGEKATIVANPESGEWYDDGMVWIRFDNDNKVYGPEKGYAILSQQWYEIDRLREI